MRSHRRKLGVQFAFRSQNYTNTAALIMFMQKARTNDTYNDLNILWMEQAESQ